MSNVPEIEAWPRCVLNDWVHMLEQKFIDLRKECETLKGHISHRDRLLLESRKLTWDFCRQSLTVFNELKEKEESFKQQIEQLEKENKELKSFRDSSDLLFDIFFCKARKQLEDLECRLNQANMESENLRETLPTLLRKKEKINYFEKEIAELNEKLRVLEKTQKYLRVLCPNDVYSTKGNKSRNLIANYICIFSFFFSGVLLLLFLI